MLLKAEIRRLATILMIFRCEDTPKNHLHLKNYQLKLPSQRPRFCNLSRGHTRAAMEARRHMVLNLHILGNLADKKKCLVNNRNNVIK
jgi:hypothetical protein